jgi:hypothetical protein
MLCKLPANTKSKNRSSFYAFKSCEIDHLIVSVLCVKRGCMVLQWPSGINYVQCNANGVLHPG